VDDVAQKLRLGLHADARGKSVGHHLGDRPDGVDVALHEVPAEAVAGSQGKLEIDAGAGLQVAQRGAIQGLVHHLGPECVRGDLGGGQAHAVDRHRVALGELPRQVGLDLEHDAPVGALVAGDSAQALHQTRKHVDPSSID
jgi:hypothetical protein